MRIKFMTLLLLLIAACLSVTGCIYADSQTNDKDNDMENNEGSFSDVSDSNLEPMQNQIKAHSWQELKLLYDASKGGNEDFLLALESLDDQCLIERASHMFFDHNWQKEEAETFLKMFNSVSNYSLLVPKYELETRMDYIVIEPVAGGISLKEVYRFVYKDQEYVFGVHSGDFREKMKQQDGDPIDVITGNGYTAKIWLFREAKGRYQAYHGYIILDGADYPTIEVILEYVGIRPDDIPKELLPRFGEFDITTTEKILEDIDS